jgi:hypothetical protein
MISGDDCTLDARMKRACNRFYANIRKIATGTLIIKEVFGEQIICGARMCE